MIPFLRRTFATLRTWLGMNDPSENYLHASHGWLLPVPAPVPPTLGTTGPAADRVGRSEGGR